MIGTMIGAMIGARITGPGNLEVAKIIAPIRLEQCLFEVASNLAEAEAVSVRMSGCQTPGLQAAGLRTRGDLELNDGFISVGQVDLPGANIGGGCRMPSSITRWEMLWPLADW